VILSRLRYLELVLRKSLMQHRIAGSRFSRERDRGRGQDFSRYTMYTPGDDFRYVDWNVYARTGKLFLRIFKEEPEGTVYFLLDASGSMLSGGRRKTDFAALLIIALSYISLKRGDRIRVIPFSDGRQLRQPSPWFKGVRAIVSLMDWLERAVWSGCTDFHRGLEKIAPLLRKRGIIFLVSDFLAPLDGISKGLKYIMRKDLHPVLLHLYSEEEANPLLEEGITYILEDSEVKGNTLKVKADAASRVAYRDHFRMRLKDIHTICTRHHMSFIAAPVNEDVIPFVLDHIEDLGLRSLA
jgi:uncharacterized protein (DUF58 family)